MLKIVTVRPKHHKRQQDPDVSDKKSDNIDISQRNARQYKDQADRFRRDV